MWYIVIHILSRWIVGTVVTWFSSQRKSAPYSPIAPFSPIALLNFIKVMSGEKYEQENKLYVNSSKLKGIPFPGYEYYTLVLVILPFLNNTVNPKTEANRYQHY